MTKLISSLLGAKEPDFSMAIKQLEDITGRQAIDVKLTAEILSKIRIIVEQLGLDPADTTPKELYFALMNKIRFDDERFIQIIGAQPGAEPKQLMELVVKAVGKLTVPKKCWVIKKSVAKELLKKTPPKHVMDWLHYKSVDSMLKNANIFEIFGAMQLLESQSWQDLFTKRYRDLTPSDFEIRGIEILAIPEERWDKIGALAKNQKSQCAIHSIEMGAIIILPPDNQNADGFATLLALLLIHYLNEIRSFSSFFKLQQVKPDFTATLVDTLKSGVAHVAVIGAQPIHWRVVQQHLGKKRQDQPQLFEPHVQWEDLQWQRAEKSLAKIDSDFGWWQGLGCVGLKNDKALVSLNLLDVVLNYYLGAEFENSSNDFLKSSLWNELFSRYMNEKVVEQQVLRQLDIDMTEEESIFELLMAGGI